MNLHRLVALMAFAFLMPSASLKALPPGAPDPPTWTNSLGMHFRSVTGTGVQFSTWDTRVEDYQVFCKEAKRAWKKPDFKQTEIDPAVNVSWEDAKAFCDWLTKREHESGVLPANKTYRLPTVAEWSTAVGKEKYPWGNEWPPPIGEVNYDQSLHTDSFSYTSPVGSFSSNKYGLYDMGGNVWQWCEDPYRKEMNSEELRRRHKQLNNDHGGNVFHVLRGGAWDVKEPDTLLSTYCEGLPSGSRYDDTGFRVVVADAPYSAQPEQKHVDAPVSAGRNPEPGSNKKGPHGIWTNNMGMQFRYIAGIKLKFGVWDTRVRDYQAFCDATGRKMPHPSFHQTENDPVVNVTWEDAKAFCDWLTKREHESGTLDANQIYRLPSDTEWSFAAGQGKYSWGNQWPPPVGAGNYAPSLKVDDFSNTSPVGSFKANKYGLYDMGGNVGQWCEDSSDPNCKTQSVRGGSFSGADRELLRSSFCLPVPRSYRSDTKGFRVVVANIKKN